MKTSADMGGADRMSETQRPKLQSYLDAGRSRGVSWTPLRLQIMKLLWTHDRPWGRYELADALRKGGAEVYTNSIYRILSTLEEARLVIPIASSRAVQISPHPHEHDWAFVRCSHCEKARLIPFGAPARVVRDVIGATGHIPQQLVIECGGECAACQPTNQATHHTTPHHVRDSTAGLKQKASC
ncbi:Fur family transcriptional regulator [Tsuneonella amylolytica]|uniref:Fur family transcriptional regulator n=1 Tax=Tsuneonella amylolytica TaxID=2338327 RepID=UPI000EA94E80|nr:transcriptional repressor [Tsuneonella amylolytica]